MTSFPENKIRTPGFTQGHFTPFIVLTRSRTGSTLLISYLDSHSRIKAENEIFHRIRDNSYESILNQTFSKQPPSISAKGFKIFYYHPMDDKSGKLWDYLLSIENLHVIHLKRNNILRTIISRKIAGTQNVWSVREDTSKSHTFPKKTIELSVDEVENEIRYTRRLEDWGDERFKNHPLISIYYEDLVARPEETFRKILQFLGIAYEKPRTDLIRQNPEAASELVVNYPELKAHFLNTEYSQYFNEDR